MRLYNYKHELLAYLNAENITVEKVLGGVSTLSFSIDKYMYDQYSGEMVEDERFDLVVNECLVEYEEEFYIIKDVTPYRDESGVVVKDVGCKHISVELSSTKIDGLWGYSPSIESFAPPHNRPTTIYHALTDLLSNYTNGWEIGILPTVEKNRTFEFEWATPMQIIVDLSQTYDYVPRFRTEVVHGEIKKYVDILTDDYGEIKGYYRHDYSLDSVRSPINSDGITTRLYVFGYNDITINEMMDETKEFNGVTYSLHKQGQSYIDNFDYFLAQGYTYEECLENFIRVDTVKDDLYVDPNDLYDYAKTHIEKIGMPTVSYSVSIKDIEFDGKPELELGHKIRIYDEELKVNLIARVSKIGYADDDKANKTIEITNYYSYFNQTDLLTDLILKQNTLKTSAVTKNSKFATSVIINDTTGIIVQAKKNLDSLARGVNTDEFTNYKDVVRIGQYELGKTGIQILDGQLQLDREDRITRVKIDNTDGIMIFNNPNGDGFEDEHKVFYVDVDGNLVAQRIIVRDGYYYLRNGQEIETVIGEVIDSVTGLEQGQSHLEEITKVENIISTVTESEKYINDLLSKVDTIIAEEESKRIEQLISISTSVDRIVSTVVESERYAQDLLAKADSATVNSTISSVKSELNDKITSLDGKVGQATLAIETTSESLKLKADRVDVYTKNELDLALSDKANQSDLSGVIERVSSTETELEIQAGQISSKVEKTTYETAIGSIQESLNSKADSSSVVGLIERVTVAESGIVQNAEEIASKVSNTTYQQDKANLETRVTTAETTLTQQAESITLKADKTDVYSKNETDQKVSAIGAELSLQADKIEAKVSKTDYAQDMSLFGTRLDKAESSITQTADEISQKVSKIEYAEDKNGILTRLGTAESGITQNADAIALKASKIDVYTKAETDDKLDEIEVGGRNYIRNSGNFIDLTNWTLNGGTSMNLVTKDGYSVIEGVGSIRNDITIPIEAATTYIYSAEVMFGSDTNVSDSQPLHFWMGTSSATVRALKKKTLLSSSSVKANTWTRIIIKLETTDSITAGDYFKAFMYGSVLTSTNKYWLKNIKFEKGTKATDWTPTPEDIESKVSSVEAELKVQSDKIEAKVSKTEYAGDISDLQSAIDSKADESTLSALAQRVSTAESSITQTAEQITQKVSKTDYDKGLAGKADTSTVTALGTRLSTAETTLTQQAGQIALKASKTDVYTKGETDDKINDIQIGVRNLVLNSKTILLDKSDNLNKNCSVVENDYVKITPIYKGNVYNASITTSTTRKQGEVYTLSFEVLTPTNIGFYWYPSEKYVKDQYIKASSSWQKVTFTYTQSNADVTGSTSFLFGFSNVIGGEVYCYRNLKLEYGNKATDWTPAPEDIDTRVTSVEAELEVQADAISQRVTKYDYQQDKSATDTRLSKAESSIIQNAESIKQTVTKTEWNGDKSQINERMSSIETDLDSITSRVSNTEITTSGLSGNVSDLAIRMSTAEQKITDSAIISTVSQTINQAKTEAINSANSNTSNLLKNYSTTSQMNSAINQKANEITSSVSQTYATKGEVSGNYATKSELTQTSNSLTAKFSDSSSGGNLVANGDFLNGKDNWWVWGGCHYWENRTPNCIDGAMIGSNEAGGFVSNQFRIKPNTKYTLSFDGYAEYNVISAYATIELFDGLGNNRGLACNEGISRSNQKHVFHFTTGSNIETDWTGQIMFKHNGSHVAYSGYLMVVNNVCLTEGHNNGQFVPATRALYEGVLRADKDGLTVTHSVDDSYSKMGATGFEFYSHGSGHRYHNLMKQGWVETISFGGLGSGGWTTTITLPYEFRNKPFSVIPAITYVGCPHIADAVKMFEINVPHNEVNYANGTFRIYIYASGLWAEGLSITYSVEVRATWIAIA